MNYNISYYNLPRLFHTLNLTTDSVSAKCRSPASQHPKVISHLLLRNGLFCLLATHIFDMSNKNHIYIYIYTYTYIHICVCAYNHTLQHTRMPRIITQQKPVSVSHSLSCSDCDNDCCGCCYNNRADHIFVNIYMSFVLEMIFAHSYLLPLSNRFENSSLGFYVKLLGSSQFISTSSGDCDLCGRIL